VTTKFTHRNITPKLQNAMKLSDEEIIFSESPAL
jgi:hypothetical protein